MDEDNNESSNGDPNKIRKEIIIGEGKFKGKNIEIDSEKQKKNEIDEDITSNHSSE